jgi:hypothetical protein
MVLVQQSSLLGHNGPVTIDPGVSCALEHQALPAPLCVRCVVCLRVSERS